MTFRLRIDRKRRQAWPGPGPLPLLWGLGAGSGPQNVKTIRKTNVKMIRFHTFTLFSHFNNNIFISLSHLWAQDPDPGPKGQILPYSCSCYSHIFVHAWAGGPVHCAIFERCGSIDINIERVQLLTREVMNEKLHSGSMQLLRQRAVGPVINLL